ncbi:MAG TPA: hypothetical protein VED20_13445 [Streptosporangiaceae bacterium]|nr:hypothetical protein [Streptosporangiaceae bacterium]
MGRGGNVLLGTLPHSGRTRGVLDQATDQPHLVEVMDGVLRRHGGTARRWWLDRMASMIVPGTGSVQRSFASVGAQVIQAGRDERTPLRFSRISIARCADLVRCSASAWGPLSRSVHPVTRAAARDQGPCRAGPSSGRRAAPQNSRAAQPGSLAGSSRARRRPARPPEHRPPGDLTEP